MSLTPSLDPAPRSGILAKERTADQPDGMPPDADLVGELERDGAQRRPVFHFTPRSGWMNDPCGLTLHEGEHHLFYQHNPHADVWGPMHWGHAVSPDSYTWQELPIALSPDHLGWIYSGSVVIDHDNSSGFGAGSMVAVFTHAGPAGQSQSLAWSNDNGREWNLFGRNPVIAPPAGEPDFRDPQVLWWERDGHWVMTIATGRRVRFYVSQNLREWDLASELAPMGVRDETAVETPDLFELPLDGTDETRWVLTFGVMSGGPAGGTGTRYLVGSFDGRSFEPAGMPEQSETAALADHGPDFYAARSWSGTSIADRSWVAWMGNWAYAERTPSSGWRGAMTCPRRLGLARTDERIVLTQTPVALPDHRLRRRVSTGPLVLTPTSGDDPLRDLLQGAEVDAFDLSVRLRREHRGPCCLEILAVTGAEEWTSVVCDLETGVLTVDRMRSGPSEIHRELGGAFTVPVNPRDGVVDLRVLGDACSIEVLTDAGASITTLVFPSRPTFTLGLRATGGPVRLEALDVYEIL